MSDPARRTPGCDELVNQVRPAPTARSARVGEAVRKVRAQHGRRMRGALWWLPLAVFGAGLPVIVMWYWWPEPAPPRPIDVRLSISPDLARLRIEHAEAVPVRVARLVVQGPHLRRHEVRSTTIPPGGRFELDAETLRNPVYEDDLKILFVDIECRTDDGGLYVRDKAVGLDWMGLIQDG